jgi:acetylglutamate kinase
MLKSKKDKVIVVKIGGSTLGQHDTTLQDLVELQKRGRQMVVVHGGGKIITEWLTKQGSPAQFVQGERVTDRAGLEVVAAVLGGLVNKNLVAGLNDLGGRAVGISGVDGSLIQGKIKDKALGYTGAVVKVEPESVVTLLESGFIPVISPVSVNLGDRPAESSLLLNVNADTAAGEIAAALRAEKLVFLTDIAGICDKTGNVINRLTAIEAEAMIDSGVASGGMIPKIRAGIRALDSACTVRIIDGRKPHALLAEMQKSRGGTSISKEN